MISFSIGQVLLLTILGFGALLGAEAIYPDNHWKYSTKLTTSNFEDTIKSYVDSDKTLMQAPAWNHVVERFANYSDSVAFGDINLSEESIRGAPHNPGAGGWPTIRYFNKETGVDGANYVKKTSGAMCDELGDKNNMEDYVVSAAGIVLCDVASGAGCTEKEAGFLESWKAKGADSIAKEIARLQGIAAKGTKLKPDVKAWNENRVKLLKAIADMSGHQEL